MPRLTAALQALSRPHAAGWTHLHRVGRVPGIRLRANLEAVARAPLKTQDRPTVSRTASLPSPLGPIGVTAEQGAITRLSWPVDAPPPDTALHRRTAEQLTAYFAGGLIAFDLPLRPQGSAFEQAVWAQMLAIPFGETRTYGDIAKALNSAAQPVGNACGANPLPILIPCHRVLGANSLGGFSASGGVEDKVWLLRHEGAAGLLI